MDQHSKEIVLRNSRFNKIEFLIMEKLTNFYHVLTTDQQLFQLFLVLETLSSKNNKNCKTKAGFLLSLYFGTRSKLFASGLTINHLELQMT